MLRLVPIYDPKPWGGRQFEELFGRQLPEEPVGESWELVELGERHSVIAGGDQEGRKLGEVWRSGDLGGSGKGAFPLVLKWLETSEWLSVQVHPDAASCERLGKGTPKTEAWYVAHAAEEAKLLAGHYPGIDAMTLRQAASGGTISKWLYELQPRVGEMLLLPAGTLHAIGPGLVLLEVQQPSDTTYRLYDWGRVGLDGQPRELHVEEAAESVVYERSGPPTAVRDKIEAAPFQMLLVSEGEEISPDILRVFVAGEESIRLSGSRGSLALARGDVVLGQVGDGPLMVQGGSAVVLTEAGATTS